MFATVEIDYNAYKIKVREVLVRLKAQPSGGSIFVIPYLNGVEYTGVTQTQVPRNTGETAIRHRFSPAGAVQMLADHIALKFRNNQAGRDFYLENIGLDIQWHEKD